MNNILWIISVFLFAGVWVEIIINVGYIGIIIGWFPGFVISYLWLSMTGRLKHNEGC